MRPHADAAPVVGSEQCVVDGVSYQRMGEQKDAAICLLWPDEKPRYQAFR